MENVFKQNLWNFGKKTNTKSGIPSRLRDLESPRSIIVFKMFKPKEGVNAKNHCKK
jgi:hypothetical protein